ncbi:hypothetical protein F5X99DRAFT_402187 [Biscogniauxia marginata]|nr:hypothetical protein F5X99DRAFT_402187 [Biscogniauxia marginata]
MGFPLFTHHIPVLSLSLSSTYQVLASVHAHPNNMTSAYMGTYSIRRHRHYMNHMILYNITHAHALCPRKFLLPVCCKIGGHRKQAGKQSGVLNCRDLSIIKRLRQKAVRPTYRAGEQIHLFGFHVSPSAFL